MIRHTSSTVGLAAFGADAATRAAIAASAGESVLADMMAHLVFTRPFEPNDAHASRHGLGGDRVRADPELAAAVAGLGERYWTADEALIHGARSELPTRDVVAWLGQVRSDAIGYAGCEILPRLASGDLVVPLTSLSDRDRYRAADTLLDLATQAVLHRAEMTVHELVSGGARLT